MREKVTLEKHVERFKALLRLQDDAETLLELWEEAPDQELEQEAFETLRRVESLVGEAEIQRLLSDEGDEAAAVLEINSGETTRFNTIRANRGNTLLYKIQLVHLAILSAACYSFELEIFPGLSIC